VIVASYRSPFYTVTFKGILGAGLKTEDAINEIIGETLILGLIVLIAVILAVTVFGHVLPIDKSAYVATQFGTKVVAGKTVITAYDRGGDPVYFNATPLAKYHAAFYVDTALGSFKAQPVSSIQVFKAGDTVYLYYTGTGFVLSNTLTGAPIVTLPSGRVTVRLVDTYSGTLISQETVVQGPVAALPVGNMTPTTTATPTLTATPTPTVTPTPTATPPMGMLVANFGWIEKGKGGDVHFTDTSSGSPSSWSWDFGDGSTSTSQNPVHNFGKGASSSVTLTISRSSDSATGSITQTITTV
jgi:hypothetical protein